MVPRQRNIWYHVTALCLVSDVFASHIEFSHPTLEKIKRLCLELE